MAAVVAVVLVRGAWANPSARCKTQAAASGGEEAFLHTPGVETKTCLKFSETGMSNNKNT